MDDTSTMRPILTCFGCKKGYHASCFALFHCKQALDVNQSVLAKFHEKLTNPGKDEKGRMLANRCTPDKFEEIVLPKKRARGKGKEDESDDGGGKPKAKKRAKVSKVSKK